VLTGKGLEWGGAQARREATGYGCAFFVEEMLAADGGGFDGATVAVSGAGNVAIYAIEEVQQLGGRVVACSDTTAFVHDDAGIDVTLLKQVKQSERGSLEAYAERRNGRVRFVPDATIWDVQCAVALPCATQNELTGRDAERPSPTGSQRSGRAPTCRAPRVPSNAGGVGDQRARDEQNASRDSWTFDYTEQRLRCIMRKSHSDFRDAAMEYGMPGDYLAGANILGFTRVARAMLALGLT
jgi:glutamate dehydrogenase (NADP+)